MTRHRTAFFKALKLHIARLRQPDQQTLNGRNTKAAELLNDNARLQRDGHFFQLLSR
jgi:hypothetical protein